MNVPDNKRQNFFILIPCLGILLFVILYIIATLNYPGGSTADKTAKGFDWLHNYWCDLTGEIAKNGEINSARPIALAAMLILCSSLTFFWYYLPLLFNNFRYNNVIRYCGILSMLIAMFLFTGYHDMVINIAGTLGCIALSFTFAGLYQNKLYNHFFTGLFCLVLILFNYFIYQTSYLRYLLPIVQKITFICFLSWICLMNIQIYRHEANS